MSKSTENIDLELKNSKPQATSSSTTLNVDECSNSSSINSEAGNLNIVIEEEATENNHEESANNTKSSKIVRNKVKSSKSVNYNLNSRNH